MDNPITRFEQVKTIWRQGGPSRYAVFRESLRILIPYEWRRRSINLVRSHFGLKIIADLIAARLLTEKIPLQRAFKRGDFYEAVTLLPHLPEAEVKAVLKRPPAPTVTARPDVICFSIIDWSFRFQRPQQLMAQFAAHGHRVFYLSVTQYRSRYAQPKFSVRQIRENVFEVQLAARAAPEIYRAVIKRKDAELALDSLDELRRTYNINEAICYVMISSWGRVALETKRRWGWRVIYDCMDEWENFPGIKPPLLEMERQLVQRGDLLVVTAQRLYDKWQSSPRPLVLARNAADYDFFAERCRPNELLAHVKHPIIGYYGAIADWFDVELMAELARQRTHYHFVLLGGTFDVDVARLRQIPNVQFLGQQPYETMPQYLYHFDACIIPFKINPITEATDPVKLYEYLSGGKPVVSVNLPELAPYRDYVYIADGPADFAAKLDQALAENNQQAALRRKSLAQQHTWAERYTRIIGKFKEVVPQASIIIVTYNNRALTKLCLESVFRNTDYPNFEVVVVDNQSSDDTQMYLRKLAGQYDNLKVILNEENCGFAKANNQGIEKSTGEYLVLLNNDTIVPQGWLSRLLRHLDDPQVGIIGPVTNFVGNEAKIEVAYRSWAEMEAFAQDFTWLHGDQAADIFMLAMFCVAMRRRLFDKVGPLDERFGIGMFEDDDYSLRVKQQGYRVVCAKDVFVHHFGQAAFGQLIRSGSYDSLFNENRLKFETKWGVEWQPHQHAELVFTEHRIAHDSNHDI
jgi:GT2 family glycosyltransferase/glycosyltransferase involved in cell wall biosynthesis